MNNKFDRLFTLQAYYGSDVEILKTQLSEYPLYDEDGNVKGTVPIVYFDFKIYSEYVFVGVHQSSDESDYMIYKGKTILLNYFSIPTQIFKLIPIQYDD